jgi:hypothetical protein
MIPCYGTYFENKSSRLIKYYYSDKYQEKLQGAVLSGWRYAGQLPGDYMIATLLLFVGCPTLFFLAEFPYDLSQGLLHVPFIAFSNG